ncbi:MAG TPA: phenylalanine--tRNA ligase subunit beta, partial [Solirubrobacteraceae bacterium]|nr:phenylalanine--tRNA ligase subunit beta [Solirubrobacteraceae bacterium]
MRLPLEWLDDYCAPGLDAAALADRLDMTGTKVERILRHGVQAPDGFVVGRVIAAEAHPDADRLTLCRVEVGGDEISEIVCGAPNVAAGQTVAVALPGAVMPDGSVLSAANLRGVRSHGMILAEDEIGLGSDHAGILVLDDGIAPGTPLAEVLPIGTDVLELELTPNRPDCLGVYGVAREVHAATGAPLAEPPWSEDPGSGGAVEGGEVVVECPELCPRFTARYFDDVEVGPSPPWLRGRLMAAGQRPISNVVDITNYVMLATGQPLHAFDLDRVPNGRLIVRRARPGERLVTLDGVERSFDESMVLVCDEDGPSGVAGVIGGARSEVSGATTRVLLESATWDGPNIHRTSQRLGVRSEASGRFEKQLAPEQAMYAQALATQLMIELCGAAVRPGTIDVGGDGPAPAVIRLRAARVAGLLGAPISRDRAREILESLDLGCADAADGLDVSVPPLRRTDVTREADLIEEVARIDGFDRLPATIPRPTSFAPTALGGAAARLSLEQALRRRAEDVLAARGCSEVAGWSMVSPEVDDRLRLPPGDSRRDHVVLANPLSQDQSAMRTLLLGSLLDAAARNVAQGAGDVRLFELGAVFRAGGSGPLPDERRHIGALMRGCARSASWRDPEPPQVDLFAGKGLLAGLLDTLRVPFQTRPGGEPFLNPGRAAEVLVGGE